MQVQVFTSTGNDAGHALARDIAGLQQTPSFVSIHGNVDCDPAPLVAALQATPCAVLVASSSMGALSDGGATDGLAAFVLSDPEGAYGSASRSFSAGSALAAETATRAALVQASRPGEKPDLVWVSSTPGAEEAVLDAIVSVVGADVPIIGGSAADNDVGGAWFVGDAVARHAEGVTVAVMFPSRPVSFAYQNGYAPTAQSGTVTRASGRTVFEIDGQPAARVYERWCKGAVQVRPDGGDAQPILAAATLWPLGRAITQLSDVPYYLLAHPAAADPSGALHLFADVAEGEVLTQMEGSADSLAERAGRVAALACRSGGIVPDDVAGALIVYCGGCMMTLRDRIEDVTASIRGDLSDVPFLATFTFGEQGPIVGAGNRHGNLMISCVVFGR